MSIIVAFIVIAVIAGLSWSLAEFITASIFGWPNDGTEEADPAWPRF